MQKKIVIVLESIFELEHVRISNEANLHKNLIFIIFN